VFCLLPILAVQVAHGVAVGFQSKIAFTGRPLHAIKESGDFDELVPGIEEIQVENLLACHNICHRHYNPFTGAGNILLSSRFCVVNRVRHA